MLQNWSDFFPLPTGTKLKVDGGHFISGAGEVELRTDDVLTLRVRLPHTLLHPAFEARVDIHYVAEGAGNRLALSQPGKPPIEDVAATAQSFASGRRTIASSMVVEGRRLEIDLQKLDASSAAITINGQRLTLRSEGARLAQPGPMRLRADASPHQEALPVIQDWAQYISFTPKVYLRPASVDELKGFVTGLARGILAGRRVRVLGSLHSCSDICISDVVVDVSDLPKAVEVSADASEVTATANVSLHELLLELGQRGKSLPATGGTDEQTLAGLISTNTAPATAQLGMYETLKWAEYITIDETTQTAVEKRVSNGDPEFPAVVCSLGALGILTKVCFGLIDEPYFKTIQKVISLDEVLTDVRRTSQQYDFWRIDWLPDSTRGLLWAAQRIPREEAVPEGDYQPDAAENILVFLFKCWDKFAGSASGPLLDGFMRLIYSGLATFYNLDEPVATGPLRNMLPVDRRAPLHVAMAEWSFDPADLPRVLASCREYFGARGWPNLPIEIELTKTDGYFMSPWNWDGLDFIVKLNFMYLTDVCQTPQEKGLIQAHLRGLWDHFLSAGIRLKAHWGKINFLDPQIVRDRYQLDRFKPHVRSLFLNPYLTDRFGNP